MRCRDGVERTIATPLRRRPRRPHELRNAPGSGYKFLVVSPGEIQEVQVEDTYANFARVVDADARARVVRSRDLHPTLEAAIFAACGLTESEMQRIADRGKP